jgi:hypothetical protein
LRRHAGGVVSGNSRVTIFGGCSSDTLAGCPIQDASVLSFPDQTTEVAKRGSPTWAKAAACQPPRFGAAMTKSPNDNYNTKVFSFGGAGSPLNGHGLPGEVGVLDTDTGMWTILRPAASGGKVPYPKLRHGARMVSTVGAISPRASIQGSDIIMFGGMSLDESDRGEVLQDTWILRVFDRAVDMNKAFNVETTTTANIHALQDDPASNDTVPTSTTTSTPTSAPATNSDDSGEGGKMLDQADGTRVETAALGCPVLRDPIAEHAMWMSLSVVLLPIAITMLRFFRPAVQTRPIYTALCALCFVGSLGLAVYGLVVAYQMLGGSNTAPPYSHLRVPHSIIGVIMLVLAWIVTPVLAMNLMIFIRKMRYRAAKIAGQDVREINFDDYSQPHLGKNGGRASRDDNDRASLSGSGSFEVLNDKINSL